MVSSLTAQGGGATSNGRIPMSVKPKTTRCVATWWDDNANVDLVTFVPETEEVEIEIYWEGDSFYIEGLRQGQYLTVPLYGFAKPIADGSAPAEGLAR
jgi:hypothetical protein